MRIFKVKANKNYPDEFVCKRDIYYYCSPQRRKTGGIRKIRSTSEDFIKLWIQTYMKRFQGEFSSNMDNWNKQFAELSSTDEQQQLIEDIETFLDEKQSNLDNMPYQLQESSVLNEQIEELEQLLQEVNEMEIDEQ